MSDLEAAQRLKSALESLQLVQREYAGFSMGQRLALSYLTMILVRDVLTQVLWKVTDGSEQGPGGGR